MKNLSPMVKQAEAMQTRMAEVQEQLGRVEITGVAGGGLVEVTLSGKGEMRGVRIERSLMDAEEKEVLEDLIVAAHNDARVKVETHLSEEMSKLTGGLDLPPGLKLPF